MNLTRFAMNHRTVVLAVTAVMLVYGLQTFQTMPRREDPEITIRTCIVTTLWPGASAEKVEELVTDPLETVINQIDEVEEIRSDSRSGMSLIFVDIDERLFDIDQYYDEVRNKIDLVVSQLPDGCGKPAVNSDFGDVDSVVFAFYQAPPPGRDVIDHPYSYRELELLAEKVEDELKGIETVAKVEVMGVPDEVIYVEVDAADWAKIDLTTSELRQLLEARNIVASGGEVNTDTTRFSVKPSGEFVTVDQMKDVIVASRDEAYPIRLGDLPLQITRDVEDPFRTKFRFQSPDASSDRALLVRVVMKSGSNVVEMGEQVKAAVDELKATSLPPDIELVRINDLPSTVDTLVVDFVNNLGQAIAIVLLVAFLMMGWRPAVIMAAAVPLCMIASILVVSLIGVELEQFSIASLIIALGMLVDNAIVVSDNVLRELKEKGEDRIGAVIRGSWSLAIPVLTSTFTTVGAFLPMLTIVGGVGEYTRSLPMVVATTLLVSYVVAMMVTPIMCFWLLRPTFEETAPRRSFLGRALDFVLRRKSAPPAPKPEGERGPGTYERLIRWCLAHRLLTIGGAGAAVVASFMLVPYIGSQFFPGGVRDQFFIHVWLPEGSSIHATESVCAEVETIIRETAETEVDGEAVNRLKYSTSFVGTGGPRLNLTTNPEQNFPNYAHILVNTTDALLSADWAAEIAVLTDKIPGTRINVVPFRLGPYIENPVEYKLSGPDADLLREKAAEMVAIFRETPGAVNPTSDWSNDGYRVDVKVDSQRANVAQVTNKSVAETMDTLLSGGRLTTYREGEHQVAVVLRIRKEQREDVLAGIGEVYVNGKGGKVPLGSIADIEAGFEPAVISRLDTVRTVGVGAQVEPGTLSNTVMAAMLPKLDAMMETLPPGYKLIAGGELEQTQESSAKLAKSFTLSFFLILLVLIAQYNSIIKPLVILSTVPLALIGALLGLYSTGWALGFMPSLGIISLAGVVINNAIILVDFIEGNVRAGDSLEDAIAKAGSQRMQPIVLTTLTTVGGMIPLALFGGPMWAGMSWAMIVGLSLSTGLTLLVVPTIFATAVQTFRVKIATA